MDGLVEHRVARTAAIVLLALPVAGVGAVAVLYGIPALIGQVDQLIQAAPELLAALASQGILGGYDLSADYPELGPALLVCATEARTAGDIQRYLQAAANLLYESSQATG